MITWVVHISKENYWFPVTHTCKNTVVYLHLDSIINGYICPHCGHNLPVQIKER